MKIRKAQISDLPDIIALYQQPDMDSGGVLSVKEAEAIFLRMASYPNYHVFVAEEAGSITGTFALAIMDNLAHKGAPSGLIEDVVVRSDLQGQGIGKEMMHYAMDYCRSCNCYKVSLSSNLKRVKAHDFYESLGFQKHGYSFQVELNE